MDFIYILLILVALVLLVLALKYFLNKAEEDKPLPYKAKPYLFSRSEHEFLRVLHEQIDNDRYLIFPKVRLADFIAVTARGKEYQGWWNKIRSKHVDFLVWDAQQNKIALAIELDGSSHSSEKMQTRDEFVNKLYERIDVRLGRVQVGSDFATEVRIILELLIK